MSFEETIETVGKVVDVVGVGAMILGILAATVIAAANVRRKEDDTYRRFRQDIGRAILLGLELLVAADIIRTVAISPTFESVGVLAIIVAVRTFLSMALQVELEGRWPWQRERSTASG